MPSKFTLFEHLPYELRQRVIRHSYDEKTSLTKPYQVPAIAQTSRAVRAEANDAEATTVRWEIRSSRARPLSRAGLRKSLQTFGRQRIRRLRQLRLVWIEPDEAAITCNLRLTRMSSNDQSNISSKNRSWCRVGSSEPSDWYQAAVRELQTKMEDELRVLLKPRPSDRNTVFRPLSYGVVEHIAKLWQMWAPVVLEENYEKLYGSPDNVLDTANWAIRMTLSHARFMRRTMLKSRRGR